MKKNTRDYGKFHPRFAEGGAVHLASLRQAEWDDQDEDAKALSLERARITRERVRKSLEDPLPEPTRLPKQRKNPSDPVPPGSITPDNEFDVG